MMVPFAVIFTLLFRFGKGLFFKNGKEFIMRFFSYYQIFSLFDSYFVTTPSQFTVIAWKIRPLTCSFMMIWKVFPENTILWKSFSGKQPPTQLCAWPEELLKCPKKIRPNATTISWWKQSDHSANLTWRYSKISGYDPAIIKQDKIAKMIYL